MTVFFFFFPHLYFPKFSQQVFLLKSAKRCKSHKNREHHHKQREKTSHGSGGDVHTDHPAKKRGPSRQFPEEGAWVADNFRKCRQKLNLDNAKGSRIWRMGSSPAGPARIHANRRSHRGAVSVAEPVPSLPLPDPAGPRGVTLSVQRTRPQKPGWALLATEKTANHRPAVSRRMTTERGLPIQWNGPTSHFTG